MKTWLQRLVLRLRAYRKLRRLEESWRLRGYADEVIEARFIMMMGDLDA